MWNHALKNALEGRRKMGGRNQPSSQHLQRLQSSLSPLHHDYVGGERPCEDRTRKNLFSCIVSQSQNGTWERLQVTHESPVIQTELGKAFFLFLQNISCRAKDKIWERRGWRASYILPSGKGQRAGNTEGPHLKTNLSMVAPNDQHQPVECVANQGIGNCA